MPLFIQGFAKISREVPTLSRWNTGGYSLCFECGSEFIAVVTFVTDQTRGSIRQSRIDQFCSNMIAHIPFTQAHDDRSTMAITNRMQFGIQATFCAPDTAGNIPFLSKLQAVRWAFKCVASIIKVPGLSAFVTNALNILSKTPNLLHLMKRL